LPKLVQRAIRFLEIRDENVRAVLRRECEATFSDGHLVGYFEVIEDASAEIWFVDYNRLLVSESPQIRNQNEPTQGIILNGQTGARGKGRGVVLHAPIAGVKHVPHDAILVAHATRPELIGMIASSRAVVTEVGGVLSHAAIACRELGVPCLVGVKGATSSLAEGVEVIVDADAGRIDILRRGSASNG
jgi:pyruvate,water dikinase